MSPLSISSPVKATIRTLYAHGGRRACTGTLHEFTGELTVVRLEGRFGTTPALHLSCFQPQRLFEPRIVDMVSGELEVQGMERTADGSWVAQAWRLRLGD